MTKSLTMSLTKPQETATCNGCKWTCSHYNMAFD